MNANEDYMLVCDIKFIHLPDQKGPLPDYWVAIYQGCIAGGESKEKARQSLLNMLKELH